MKKIIKLGDSLTPTFNSGKLKPLTKDEYINYLQEEIDKLEKEIEEIKKNYYEEKKR